MSDLCRRFLSNRLRWTDAGWYGTVGGFGGNISAAGMLASRQGVNTAAVPERLCFTFDSFSCETNSHWRAGGEASSRTLGGQREPLLGINRRPENLFFLQQFRLIIKWVVLKNKTHRISVSELFPLDEDEVRIGHHLHNRTVAFVIMVSYVSWSPERPLRTVKNRLRTSVIWFCWCTSKLLATIWTVKHFKPD